MLNYEGVQKGGKIMPVDNWTEQELNLIAKQLKAQFPHKNYEMFYGLEFTPDQVEDAAEMVLPQHRHKSVVDYHSIRRPMFDAFARISQPPGKRPALQVVEGTFDSDGRIKWSPQEWEAVILELHTISPKAFEERLKNLSVGAVRIAMQVLDIPRRRHFKQIVGFKEQALRVWDDLPIEVKDPTKQERPIIDFESGPIMAPPVTKKTKENPMAAAIQKAFVKAEEANEQKERKAPVHWKQDEWVKIAREMHRRSPDSNYFISGFFDIDLGAIREAQRVLPVERRRGLTLTKGLREPLIQAFKDLAAEMAQEEEAKRKALESSKEVEENQSRISPTVKGRAAWWNKMTEEERKEVMRKVTAKRQEKYHVETGKDAQQTAPEENNPKKLSERRLKQIKEAAVAAHEKLAAMSPEERTALAKKSWETRRANKAKLAQDSNPKPSQSVAAETIPVMEKPVSTIESVKESIQQTIHVRAESDFFGKVLNAALPLMNVLIDEAVSRLAPSLIASMLPQFEKSLGGLVQRAIAENMPKVVVPEAPKVHYAGPATTIPVAIPIEQVTKSEVPQTQVEEVAPEPTKRPSKRELAAMMQQPAVKAKKPQIAVLMPPGSQREYLRAAFEEYDFIFIDHGKGIEEAARVCALFVANEAYLTPSNRTKLKAHVPAEKLKYVVGGLTALKRQIYIWQASNESK